MIDPKQVFSFVENTQIHTDGSYSLKWTVPEDIAYVNGHFPGHPVLPGVALVDCSYELLRIIAENTGRFLDGDNYEVKMAKFTSIVRPKMPVLITAKPKSEEVWLVEWQADGQACASLEFSLCFTKDLVTKL